MAELETCMVQLGSNVRKAKLHHAPVTIYVVDEITTETAVAFRLQLAAAVATGQPIVPVEISSPGGDVYALNAMIDAIDSCPVPVATIVTGIAASAAACLFMCGHPAHRYMAPNARLMVHTVSSTLIGTLRAADLAANANESRILNDILCGIMARQCGQPKSFFSSMIRDKDNTDVYINIKEALRLGIASSTDVPALVARVSCAFHFETLDGRAIETGNAGDEKIALAGTHRPPKCPLPPRSPCKSRVERAQNCATAKRTISHAGTKGRRAKLSQAVRCHKEESEEDEEEGDGAVICHRSQPGGNQTTDDEDADARTTTAPTTARKGNQRRKGARRWAQSKAARERPKRHHALHDSRARWEPLGHTREQGARTGKQPPIADPLGA
jgi:ATP-dependent Clp protease protease subunit